MRQIEGVSYLVVKNFQSNVEALSNTGSQLSLKLVSSLQKVLSDFKQLF